MFTKIVARILLPVFTVFVLFQPATAAAATPTFRMGSTFYPKTATGAVGAALDVVSLAGRANPWIGALALGYQVYQFAQTFTDAAGATKQALVVANGQVVPTPAGWTTDSSGNLVPPSTSSQVTLYSYSNATPASSMAQACTNLSTANGFSDGAVQSFTIGGNTYPQACVYDFGAGPNGGPGYYSPSPSTSQGCPTGYTVSGSSCALSNANTVMYPSDGMPTIRSNATGGGFTLDPRDPDNTNLPTLPSQIVTDAGATVGSDTQVIITPNTSGGLDVTTMQEYKNSDGTITTYKQTASTNSSGQVTTTDAQNYPGSISQQTASSSALAPSTSATINFPTDYARQGEAATAAKSIIDSLAAPPATDPNLATENAQLSTNANAQQQFLQGLGAKGQSNEGGALSWSLPQPVIQDNTCTDPSFTILSGTSFQRTIDFAGFCSNLMKARSILQWVLYVLTLYALFDIVSGRRVEE